MKIQQRLRYFRLIALAAFFDYLPSLVCLMILVGTGLVVGFAFGETVGALTMLMLLFPTILFVITRLGDRSCDWRDQYEQRADAIFQ